MILKYELKRIYSKGLNRFLFLAIMLLAFVFSGFAIKSTIYVNRDGTRASGLMATRKLTVAKNQWQGRLTPSVLSQVIANEHKVAEDYPTNVPNEVYASDMQPLTLKK